MKENLQCCSAAASHAIMPHGESCGLVLVSGVFENAASFNDLLVIPTL